MRLVFLYGPPACGKLRSAETYRELAAAGVFDAPAMPPPAISVDTELLSPAEAAVLIRDQLHAG